MSRQEAQMSGAVLDHLDRELRLLARPGAPEPEAAISSYLAAELSGRDPGERLRILDELSRRFAEPDPAEAPAAQGEEPAGREEMTRLVQQFLGQPAGSGVSDPAIVENFARSLDLLFNSLNEIIAVINVRLLGESPELETIRKVIGKNLELGDKLSIKEYLDQIQRAFLAAHSSFQSAAGTVISELLAELDPALLEQGKSGGLKFGPLKKAELFEQYAERHARCRRWLESGQYKESLLREFEKNCRQICQGR